MRLLSVSVFIILSLVFVGAAFAGIPNASTSTVVAEGYGWPDCDPDVAVVCPASDMGSARITVTVRNIYGDPLPGKTVTVYAIPPDTCTFCFCPGEDPQVGVTDGNGVVVFYYTDFGGCCDLQWGAECEGVILGPSNFIYIASPDNNGDCQVNLVDFGNFAADYGKTVPPGSKCHDYNCDGVINLIDFGTFALHYFHQCP
jgi:hypothetical protein